MKILFENKQLNEGPGAGYTIETKGYSLNGQINSVKVSKLKEQHYVAYAIDCDVNLTGEVDTYEASGYYAGTGEVNSLPISCNHIYLEVPGGTLNDWRIISDEDYESDNINESTLNIEALLDLIKEDLSQGECSFTYGGGWSHTTYDGQVTDDDWLSGVYYTDMKATIYLSNEKDIKKVDRMVDGYGYETMYEVVVDGIGEDAFEDEDEAVEYAKSIGAEKVRIIYETESWNGDIDIETGDTVWTNDEEEFDESLKESNTNQDQAMKEIKYLLDGILAIGPDDKINDQADWKRLYHTASRISKMLDSKSESCSKSLTEDFDEDERINALAEYLNIDPSEISNIYDNEFETPEGDYLVVDEDEARQLAKDDIENLYDDLGLESFTPGFRDWIIMNALDNDWFEEAVRESMESYVNDIAYEDGRLEEELLDAGIITEEDIENGYDEDSAREEFVEKLVYDAGDPVDYCGDNFGWDWVSKAATENNLIDMDEVVEQCIYEDGIAHFIARYDGDEIELGNGLYAYRTN